MSDFAFRNPTRHPAMFAPASIRKSSTGLWSAEMDHLTGQQQTFGHLSKAHAKAAMDERALEVFGRVPKYEE